MIVDDETDVSYFVQMILELHGYKVFSANSAEKALELMEAHPDDIQLLFTDVGLPKMDGFTLCKKARQLKPGLKTMLTSGYIDGSLKTRMTEMNIDGFISKPYEMDALLINVRTILDKNAENSHAHAA